jgi:hypothetical protein
VFPSGVLQSLFNSQPEPVLFPRKALEQVFAVLLMRSAYDAVDELDFIPMVRPCAHICFRICSAEQTIAAVHGKTSTKQTCTTSEQTVQGSDKIRTAAQDRFQSQFWKLRQAEYEPYTLQRSPLRVRQVSSEQTPTQSAGRYLGLVR